MCRDQLLGTWELQSWKLTHPDGTESYPFGEDAKGMLCYLPSGKMSVHLSMAERKPFASDSVFEATEEETKNDYIQHASYCGTFSVKGGDVSHHIEMCTCPNWIGEERVRHVELVGGNLRLTHDLEGADSELIWSRCRGD